MSNNNFNINFSHLTQFEVDILSLSITDNAISGKAITKLERDRLWDLLEELCVSVNAINSFSKSDLSLVCNSLYRYHSKYPFEEIEGLSCLKIADYIIAKTRGCY